MTQTGNDVLKQILGVCIQINKKLDNDKGTGQSSENQKSDGKVAGMTSNFLGNDKAKDLKEKGVGLQEIAKGISMMSGAMLKWMFIPKGVKNSVKYFLHDLLILMKVHGGIIGFKQTAQGLEIIGDALPKLAKGILKFGLVQKTGLVKATVVGISSLLSVIAGAGVASPLLFAGASVLAALGVALNGIANVLKSIGVVVLAFAGAIVIMVGAIYMASRLFNVGPLAAMGIIVGAISILAGGFALIGVLSPLIALSGAAITSMGIGLAAIGAGLLVFTGSFLLMNKMGISPDEAISGLVKPIIKLSLLFAGIGLLGGLIKKGGEAAKYMGIGMTVLSVGLLAMGGVGALLNMMNVDVNNLFGNIAMGIGKLALMFAGLGLFGLLIIPGTVVLIAMSASLILLGLSVLAISVITNKLGGEKGLDQAQHNIAALLSSVIKGTVKGISSGLLGDVSDEAGFWKKTGEIAKNTAILIGSIGLITGVSFALMSFAYAIKAFTQAGVIKTVTGYDSNGQPIYGDSVNVISAGENIAKSIGSFFTTLTETFNDPSIIPDKEKIERIVDILMGETGYRVLGIRWAGRPRPGLIDTISKFGSLISNFAQIDQIPVHNENGKIISYTKPTDVAKNIISTLKTFFNEFNSAASNFSITSSESAISLAQTLLGSSAYRILGIKMGKDKPGILEPIMRFAEMLKIVGSSPTEMTYIDENGKQQKMSVSEAASNIIKSLSAFSININKSLENMQPIKTSKKSKTTLESFDELNKQLSKLIKQKDGISKVAESIGKLSSNVGLLSDSLVNIDIEKLKLITSSGNNDSNTFIERTSEGIGNIINKITNKDNKVSSGNKVSTNKVVEEINTTVKATSKNDDKKDIKQTEIRIKPEDLDAQAAAIGRAVSAAFRSGQFTFTFATDKSGVLNFDS